MENDPRHARDTRAIHAGKELNATSALTPPIFQSSTFRLHDAAAGAAAAAAVAPTEFYTRWGNPTTAQCEAVINELEGAEATLLLASGMGAISTALLATLSQGDHFLYGQAIYSAVTEMGINFLPRFGVECSAVDARDAGAVEAAIRPNTRMILVETPTNPTLELCDLAAIAAIGKKHGVLTAVDGTFATPILQNPIQLGMDVVLHAATKALGGHSDLTAGAICGPKPFIEKCWKTLKLLGACLSPFEAWLLLRGLKTAPVRVERQSSTALAIATALEGRPEVVKVHYPGLPSHPQHELARRQMRAFGGIVSVQLESYEKAASFAEALRVVELAVSLGGVESLVQHPASMTHGPLPEEEIRAAGIEPGLLRLSIGLEDPNDLLRDIEQALEAA